MLNVDSIIERIAKLKGVDPNKMRDRTCSDPNVVRARLLAAHVLGSYWHDHDHGRVAQRLNCSPEHVRLADKLANTDDQFQQELKAIGPVTKRTESSVVSEQPTSKPDKSVDVKPDNIDRNKLLLDIAKEKYQVLERHLIEKKTSVRVSHARRVLAFLGIEAFAMTKEDVADTLHCSIETITRTLQEAEADYLCRTQFWKEVTEIATRHGVTCERRRVRA